MADEDGMYYGLEMFIGFQFLVFFLQSFGLVVIIVKILNHISDLV